MALLILAAAGILYLLATGIPKAYRPAQLSADERREVAYNEFSPHAMAFGNPPEWDQPYTWSVTEERLNRYLASADEIAAIPPQREPGEVYRMMERAGLAEPAVALRDGVLKLMVRTTKYNKILSADVSFAFTADKRLSIHLAAVRVGHLPIPKSQVQSMLEELRQKLATGGPSGQGHGSAAAFEAGPSEHAARLLAAIVSAIDKEPIDTELPISRRTVRIEGIDIADGRLTVRIAPAGRDAPDR